jgi:hypothetical protein
MAYDALGRHQSKPVDGCKINAQNIEYILDAITQNAMGGRGARIVGHCPA